MFRLALSRKPSAKVAVLIRTRNRPYFLRRALASVGAQTERDWIAMVLNDGGDRTVIDSVLAELPPEIRARVHVREVRPAVGHISGIPLNLGIRESRSEWIAVHDDDDTWHPEFLARSLALTAREKTQASVCLAEQVNERARSSEFETISTEPYNPWQNNGVSLFRLAEGNTVPPICVLYARAVLGVTGHYDEDLEHLEDWMFHLRLWRSFEVSFLPETLARYHLREDSALPAGDRNSIFTQLECMGRMDVKVRNRMLREDIALGRIGLGFLTNIARAHGQMFSHVRESSRERESER